MNTIVFQDKTVDYKTFLHDFAVTIAPILKELLENKSDVISQSQAYKRYGRANVERWLHQRRLEPVAKRPGKIEYKISDLMHCQSCSQDYF